MAKVWKANRPNPAKGMYCRDTKVCLFHLMRHDMFMDSDKYIT